MPLRPMGSLFCFNWGRTLDSEVDPGIIGCRLDHVKPECFGQSSQQLPGYGIEFDRPEQPQGLMRANGARSMPILSASP